MRPPISEVGPSLGADTAGGDAGALSASGTSKTSGGRPALFRFAPSPTGYLHIGNLRSALWNVLLAKRANGRFLLRFDDTDRERSKPEYETAILEDLAWLGVVPDEIVRQSDRLDRYASALAALKAAGRVYPAYETAEELDRRRKRQIARGLPPIYDRAALKLDAAGCAEREAGGRRPHWRFQLSGARAEWEDEVRGASHVETSSLSDPVLVREDGTFLYTFASVVDDAQMGVTVVFRGEDHVSNTAVQIEIFRALEAAPPRFGHHNLIVASTGEEMSKRTGALSLRSFRERQVDPMAVASVAVLTGTSEPVRAVQSLNDLAALVSPSILSRALTKFDPAEIDALSTKLLHAKPYALVAPALEALGVTGPSAEAFWLAVRPNLATLADARAWWPVVAEPLLPAPGLDAEFLRTALTVLPPEPWDEATWPAWTEAVKAQSGRKGRALFLPLRQALTGQDHGPEMKALLPLIGRERAAARLDAASV